MKNINITNIVDPTSLQPFTGNSLKFLQDAQAERAAGIIKTIITQNKGSYSLTVPYVISGCVVTDSNKDVTSGEIFYGGEFYELTGVNGTTNVAQFSIVKTQDATADPLIFSNNVSNNVHDIFKFVGTDTATVGTFDATDLVSVYGSSKITSQTNGSSSFSSTSYANITGCTYTNSSGSAKTLLIIGSCYADTNLHPENYAYMQLWDGTNSLQVSAGGSISDAADIITGFFPLSVNYVGSIANGVTITLRGKCDNANTVDFNDASLSIVEL